MATQKLQVGRVLDVVPSDDTNIPYVNKRCTGNYDVLSSNFILESNVSSFITDNVNVGDIVYFTDPLSVTGIPTASATVVGVINQNMLEVNVDITSYIGFDYIVYDGSYSDGCVLYVGSAGDVQVTTSGGDTVTFKNVNAGQFLPIYVKRVWSLSTTASSILALW